MKKKSSPIALLIVGLVIGWFGHNFYLTGELPQIDENGNLTIDSPVTDQDLARQEPLVLPSTAQNSAPAVAPIEIHAEHFFYGYPSGAPAGSDLVIRQPYALSSNDETKIANWVAYRLDADRVDGDTRQSRRWKPDPWLAENERLEPDDYHDANATLSVDRGHFAPLASFRGIDTWAETNYLSNISPQRSGLNRGVWKSVEENVRDLARKEEIYVITGPLYEREMEKMPDADEFHKVPSGYWKIIFAEEEGGIFAAAFIFDQDTPEEDDALDHLTTVDEVEKRSGINFLSDLPAGTETQIESQDHRAWASRHF